MKLLLFFLLTLPLAADFKIRITGVKNTKGDICLILFDQKEGFPSDHTKARKRLILPASQAKKGIITFILKEKSLPDCAFVALHDENSNKKADRNFIGIPKEGVAISNGVPLRPTYAKALVGSPKSPLSMKLKYW